MKSRCMSQVSATGQFDLAREIAKITAGNDSIHAHPDRGKQRAACSDQAADVVAEARAGGAQSGGAERAPGCAAVAINHLSIFVSSLTPSLPTPCWPQRKSYTYA